MEPHIEGQARVSIAVVEGSEGPVALLPTQEELVSPEADFLDASIDAQRKLGQAEVGAPQVHPPVVEVIGDMTAGAVGG